MYQQYHTSADMMSATVQFSMVLRYLLFTRTGGGTAGFNIVLLL